MSEISWYGKSEELTVQYKGHARDDEGDVAFYVALARINGDTVNFLRGA